MPNSPLRHHFYRGLGPHPSRWGAITAFRHCLDNRDHHSLRGEAEVGLHIHLSKIVPAILGTRQRLSETKLQLVDVFYPAIYLPIVVCHKTERHLAGMANDMHG